MKVGQSWGYLTLIRPYRGLNFSRFIGSIELPNPDVHLFDTHVWLYEYLPNLPNQGNLKLYRGALARVIKGQYLEDTRGRLRAWMYPRVEARLYWPPILVEPYRKVIDELWGPDEGG